MNPVIIFSPHADGNQVHKTFLELQSKTVLQFSAKKKIKTHMQQMAPYSSSSSIQDSGSTDILNWFEKKLIVWLHQSKPKPVFKKIRLNSYNNWNSQSFQKFWPGVPLWQDEGIIPRPLPPQYLHQFIHRLSRVQVHWVAQRREVPGKTNMNIQ